MSSTGPRRPPPVQKARAVKQEITPEEGAAERDPARVKARLDQAVRHWMAKGNAFLAKYGRPLVDPAGVVVQVDNNAKQDCTSTQYATDEGLPRTRILVRFNSESLRLQPMRTIQYQAPHEVAHIVAQLAFPGTPKHGNEWRHVMQEVFGKPTEVAASEAKTQDPRFLYYCKCTDREPHLLDATQHAAVQSGTSEIRCNGCYGTLYGGVTVNTRAGERV